MSLHAASAFGYKIGQTVQALVPACVHPGEHLRGVRNLADHVGFHRELRFCALRFDVTDVTPSSRLLPS